MKCSSNKAEELTTLQDMQPLLTPWPVQKQLLLQKSESQLQTKNINDIAYYRESSLLTE